VRLVAAVAIGFVAFSLLGSWIETAAGDESAAIFAYRIVGGVVITSAFGYTFRAIRQYRRGRMG
jgi:hypothetical protein